MIYYLILAISIGGNGVSVTSIETHGDKSQCERKGAEITKTIKDSRSYGSRYITSYSCIKRSD